MQTIRWGVLGCGRIARKFVADLQLAGNAVLLAAGARTQASADALADEFNIERRYASYEALVQDPDIDVIYIATPHNFHCEHTLLCLDHGKAVLCEKPFAMNAAQSRLMIAKAKEKNLFLMEALWTKFLPHFTKVKQLIDEGAIGTIQNLLVNFGFRPEPPVPQRLLDPALGGGTIMDIGIYNIFLALSLLGKPDVIEAVMTPSDTNVDLQCAVLFRYNSGALAQLFSSFTTNLPTDANISGTEGRIRMDTRFYAPDSSIEIYPGKTDTKKLIPFDKELGFGYQYEARHVTECLLKGLTESPVMSHADTLLLIETLDQVRSIAGIRYAAD